MKKCTICRIEKQMTEFNKQAQSKTGLRAHCKMCQSVADKKRRNENPERSRMLSKKNEENFKKNNPEAYKARFKRYHQSLKGRYWDYKSTAKNNNRKFELTIEEFQKITLQVCNYCGQFSENKNYCGIDRIDSNKDYYSGNIAPCCDWCNFMKSNHSLDEWVTHIKRIIQYLINTSH